MKILLHACCGPCSLEPVRLLHAAGHDLTIAFMNSNIHPRAEYDKRLQALVEWARVENIPVIEGIYDIPAWKAAVAPALADGKTTASTADTHHAKRCRLCYRMRLQEAAAYAAAHDFEGLSTTLAVSPYQFSEIIEEELAAACQPYGLMPVFQDFRPYYKQATRRSRELGMYRQNYCGCAYSDAEAAAEREQRKQQRAAEKAERDKTLAPARAAQAAARAKATASRAEYDRKQHEKRAARDAYRRAQRSTQKENDSQ